MTTTINGPKVQMPTSLSAVFEVSADGDIIGLKPEWAQFFHALQGLAYAHTRSGPTAARPTNTLDWRYVGLTFFDTDLGKPIFLKTASTTNAWVDATGAPV